MLSRVISTITDELLLDIKDLKNLTPHIPAYKKKLVEIERDIKVLLKRYQQLDKDRKMAYSFG